MSAPNVIDALKSTDRAPADAQAGASAERLKALAAQFEAMLVGQMMQQMRASMFADEDGGEDAGTAPLADALFAELSLAMTRAGGIGLADSFVTPLIRETGGGGVAGLDSGLAAATNGESGFGPAVLAPLASDPVLAGRMSSAYGWRHDPIDESVKFHRGLDIAMPVGQEVPAPQAGKVTFAGEQPGYGLTVILDHGGQLTTRYAHLSAVDVKVGDDVRAGQVIARSGATGRVTGPHLHFEVMEAGRTVNPAEKLATYTAGRPQ